MFKFFIKRFLLDTLALILLAILVYFLLVSVRGNPIVRTSYKNDDAYWAALVNGGIAQWKDPMNTKLGVDFLSVGQRFIHYIHDLFIGNSQSGHFGAVYQPRQNQGYTMVPPIFFGPLRYTLMVTIPAFVFATILGVFFGVLAAYKNGTWVDTLITIVIVILFGIPSFILAPILLILGPKIGLPVTFIDAFKDPVLSIGSMIASLVLPIFILTIGGMSLLLYFTRNEVVTVLSSEYIQIARSKGLSEREIFSKYVFRNASLPILTILVPTLIGTLGGSIIIEGFFDVPGTSIVIVNSVKFGEVNIVMFSTMFFAVIGTYATILVDMLYVALDPRITYSTASETKSIKHAKSWFFRNRKQNTEKSVFLGTRKEA